MSKNQIVPAGFTEISELYSDKYVALSNALVQAREKTSLLESKIELLAIYRMLDSKKTRKKKDAKGKNYDVHYVEINAQEIKSLIDRKGGSLYGQIEAAAIELKQKLFIYRDPKSDQFTLNSLYGEVKYDRGLLTVEFNPETEYLFTELAESYTRINLAVAFSFTKNGALQLYKLLKSFAYTLPDPDAQVTQKDQPAIVKNYSLSELRLQLGFVDLNEPEVKREASRRNPDAERMAAAEKKPKYRRWSDFYARILAPGIEEINRISDIYIDSIEKIPGDHNRVNGATIRFQKNRSFYLDGQSLAKDKKIKEESRTRNLTPEEYEELADKVLEWMPCRIRLKDIRTICEAALFDENKIQKAIGILKAQRNDVENVVGFILKAIEEDWDLPKENKKRKNSFSDIETNDYDFEKLEKELYES